MPAAAAELDGLSVYAPPASGEGVLWIHGYTLDSTIWSELWQALPGWRHIGVDLPGHGRSRRLDERDTLASLGRALARLAAHHDVRHVVGISFGAMVALEVAIESGGSLASLALGAPAVAGGPTDRAAATKHLQLATAYGERGAGPWLGELWMQSPPEIFTGAARHPRLWAALAEVVARHSWAELATNAMDRLTRQSQLPRLGAVTCPTLILVGEEDMAAFKRSAELIRRAVPRCERVYLPSTGHLGLLESGSDVAPLLLRHWQSQNPSGRDRNHENGAVADCVPHVAGASDRAS